MEITIAIIVILLMLPGLVGIVLPIFPGLPYIWLVALAYGWFTGFTTITLAQIGWLALFPLVGFFIDYLAGVVGIRLAGGSLKVLCWGTLGMVLGTLLLPPFGGLFGLGISVFIAEIVNKRRPIQATTTSLSAIFGQATGMAINLVVGIVMIGLFIAFII